MLRSLVVFSLLFGSMSVLPAADANLTEFFDRFTKEWVRAEPELATRTQYLTGPEQDRLDGQLSEFSAAARRQRTELARRSLAELRRFDQKQMTPSQRVSARVLDWQLDSIVRGERFEDSSYIFNQGIAGQPGQLVRVFADVHPARSARDIDTYLQRLAQAAPRLDAMIAEARRRAAKGVVPPRFILTATIGQIERLLGAEPSKAVLVTAYDERLGKVATIATQDRERYRAAATKLVAEQVNPAFRRAIALLQEQLRTATDAAGISNVPGGLDVYAWRLRTNTTTALTADQIHRTGLEQVTRLEGQMDQVLRQMGYTQGSFQERFAKAEADNSYPERENIRETILADYAAMIRDAEKRADTLFDIRPKAPIQVRRIPEYQERNAAANYLTPAIDGTRPGTFNVPLVGPKFSKLRMRSLANHEGVPGHHFQLALQQEDQGLPRFRSAGVLREGLTAYVEGWALYTEVLAIESGWYDDDLPSKLGAFASQLFRAKRLVVDTGLHTKGWTRQQAIDYGIPVSEVERYVAAPGQACAYMIGQLKIMELRSKAKRELGDKFSIKEFHNALLRAGSAPLEVMESVVEEYIRTSR
ncbi:MAG: DUF885 domain-containing protein [Acidobacteria bacterium]|nr:DUF885 domain-containing protein [Acidobacteriota bacterium]